MPFAAMSKQDEERLKGQQAGVNISGGAGANFATGVPGQEAPQKSSGQYANIQSYLDANKPQADAMGQKIAGNVESKAVDAQAKIQGLDAQAPKVDAYDPNEAYNNVTNLSQEQKDQYRNQRSTGGYSGPYTVDKVAGYDDTQKAVSEASTSVKNLGSESGQQQELKKTYARPSYSAGENNLDQVLLQNSEGSKKAIEGVTGKYADLDKLFDTTAQKVGGSLNEAKSQALRNKQGVIAGEEAQWKNLIDPIQARADQLNAQNPGIYQSVLDDVSDDELFNDTLQRLGLSAGQNLYDLNLGSYLNPNLTQVGLNDAATADERAKYQALADLIQDQSRTQIGTTGRNTNPVSFDKDKFSKDAAGREAAYQNDFATRTAPNGLSLKQNVEVRIPQLREKLNYVNSLGDRLPAYLYQEYGVPVDYGPGKLLETINSAINSEIASSTQAINDLNSQYKTSRTIKVGQ